MAEYLLAIDLGTSSTKVVFVDISGKIISRSEAGYPIHWPLDGYAEQDPEDWWRGVASAVKQAASGLPNQGHHLAAVGLSGQMHGTVLLDSNDRTLVPAVIWPDQRSKRQVKEITNLFGLADLVKIAGSPIFTGFQAATIRWFQQERPEVWARVKSILTPKDWLRWRLTGEKFSEPSDGSGTLLLDVTKRKWSEAILERLNIHPDLLPPVRGSKEICGYVLDKAANELDIPAGTPVIAGAADTACSILGAGIRGEKELLVTISSGGQIVAPVSRVKIDASARVHTFCSALEPEEERPGWYLNAATLSAGLSFRWLRDNLFDMKGSQAYQKMTEWGARAPAGSRGLLFLPYLMGERTPHMDPEARGMFLGLTAGHGRAEIIRSVMEGVAFACYDAYSCLFSLGIRPASITLAGGGAKSKLWQGIFANVFGLPVRPLIIEEQSALGAAMLSGEGIGIINIDETMGHWPKYGPQVNSNPETGEIYQKLFTIYRQAYRQNRELFRSLSTLSDGRV